MLDIWYARVGVARPFLKWAGGKTRFIFERPDLLPDFSGRYIEPFLGSGAVFFHEMRRRTHPCKARLGDTNLTLVRTFIAVRDQPHHVADGLDAMQREFDGASDKRAFYYAIRDEYNATRDEKSPIRFIFLNQTCWNGLFRVNRQGCFNVPFGSRESGRVVPSREAIESASAALAGADIRATSWENTVALAEPGDFVFLDPPYFSDVERGDVKYQKRLFGRSHHEHLADSLAGLAERGIEFVLTNSAEPEMVRLYRSRGLDVQSIMLPRAINSKGAKRARVPELVVRAGYNRGAGAELDLAISLLDAEVAGAS